MIFIFLEDFMILEDNKGDAMWVMTPTILFGTEIDPGNWPNSCCTGGEREIQPAHFCLSTLGKDISWHQMTLDQDPSMLPAQSLSQ